MKQLKNIYIIVGRNTKEKFRSEVTVKQVRKIKWEKRKVKENKKY